MNTSIPFHSELPGIGVRLDVRVCEGALTSDVRIIIVCVNRYRRWCRKSSVNGVYKLHMVDLAVEKITVAQNHLKHLLVLKFLKSNNFFPKMANSDNFNSHYWQTSLCSFQILIFRLYGTRIPQYLKDQGGAQKENFSNVDNEDHQSYLCTDLISFHIIWTSVTWTTPVHNGV